MKLDHMNHKTDQNELDTRAGIICVGKNWRILSTTCQCCTVHGFHGKFDTIKEVPVMRSARANIDQLGGIYILVVNKALYFSPSIDHSLINPNQIWHFRIPVSDNSIDRSKQLGIDHEQMFILFLTKGAAVYFQTHVPSGEDKESYPHVFMNDKTEWDR